MKHYGGDEWDLPQETRLIPDLGTLELGMNREAKASLTPTITRHDSIHWLTDEAPAIGFDSIEGAEFQHNKKWSKGRQDSLQGVFFGRLALGDIIETPVAVKPFLTATNAGMHEAAMMLKLESLGLRVYRLLGISYTSEQGLAVVSQFEEKSISLDNVHWNKRVDEPIGEHLTNLEAIEQVGQSLGLMHGNGFIHNDAQIKNFAVNGPEVVLIDLASSRAVVSEDGFTDEPKLRAGMFRDISRLTESIREKGFMDRSSRSDFMSFFHNVIATSYRSGLFRAGGSVIRSDDPDARQLVEEVIDDVMVRYD